MTPLSQPHRRPLLGALTALTLLATPILTSAVAQAANKTAGLSIKSFRVQAEVADRPASRARGLMYRDSLADNHGMLFVFDAPSRQCMWMKNTPLPLSVAFVKADGQIANIAQMQPQTETIHCASEDVLYALEMAQGWFWARAIKPGDVVQGLPRP
ncbi:DUF192 domain-containing protein [Betaproteobacteria bacterium LSUCC0115]|nr:DUF192 domain-containing protein [Burkholderiales bacterium LSUCC0115]